MLSRLTISEKLNVNVSKNVSLKTNIYSANNKATVRESIINIRLLTAGTICSLHSDCTGRVLFSNGQNT